MIYVQERIQNTTTQQMPICVPSYLDNFLEKLSNICHFLYKRIPNIQEVLTTTSINAAVELSLGGKALNYFGEHPNARNVFKDSTNIVTTLTLVSNKHKVGSTEYVYDESNAYAALFKFSCKTSILGSFIVTNYFYPMMTLAIPFTSIAIASNYVCEIPSRFLIVVGQYRQKANASDTPYFEFLRDKYEILWIVESVGEALLKVTVTNMLLGENIQKLDMNNAQQILANGAHNSYIKHLINKDSVTQSTASIWSHLCTHIEAVYNSDFNKPITYIKTVVATILSDYLFKFSYEVIVAYLQIPSARIAQDTAGEIIKYFKKIKEHLFDSNITEFIEFIDTEILNYKHPAQIEASSLAQSSAIDQGVNMYFEYNFFQELYKVCLIGEEPTA